MRVMTETDRHRDAEPEAHEWYAEGLRFTCTQCGNCCTGPSGFVWFDDAELTRMAEHLGLTREQFLRRYARRVGRRWSLNERKSSYGYDCIFLDRDENGKALCTIYPVRPAQCRTWPFWPENLHSPEDYHRASRRCPGMQKGLEGEGELHPLQQIRIRRDATP